MVLEEINNIDIKRMKCEFGASFFKEIFNLYIDKYINRIKTFANFLNFYYFHKMSSCFFMLNARV